jgi:PmbA protein
MKTEMLLSQTFYERIVEKLVNRLTKYSEIKFSEIYASGTKLTDIDIEQGAIKKARQKLSAGLGIRAIAADGREGLTYTTDFSDSALDRTAENALRMMKAATPRDDFKDIVHPSKRYKRVDDLYDPLVNNITLDDIEEILAPVFRLSHRDLKPVSLSGGFRPNISTTYIWNSQGVALWEKSSSISASVSLNLKKGGAISNGFEFTASTYLDDLKIAETADTAYKYAKAGLKKAKITTGKYPVLLSPRAVQEVLIGSLSPAFSGEAVQNNLSFLCEKMGDAIGNNLFTIRDDPHIPKRVGSSRFDDEGMATRPLIMINKGILENYYYNSYSAGKENLESNGHASRGGFNSPIGVSPHNLLIDPGARCWKDIVKDIKLGIYFDYTGDSPNRITGDFSGLIMTGFLIRDGKIGNALQETMIGINILDALKQIEEISSDRIWRDSDCLPWIKVADVSISSR